MWSMLLLQVALASASPESLTALARRLPGATLVAEVTGAPVAARQATLDALAAGDLALARRIAAAYATAREDSFLVRQVRRFASYSPAQQAAWRSADSLRRAGSAALGRDGAFAAIARWRRAFARARSLPDTALAAAIGGNLGRGFLVSEQLDSAATHFDRALAWSHAVGDLRVEANARTGIGALHDARGDPEAARAAYAEAIPLYERIGDAGGIAAARNNLGMLAWEGGELNEARRQFEFALQVNRRDGRDADAATNLVNLAALAMLDGRLADAERLYREALALWRADGSEADVADALLGLGQLELRRGNYPAAVRTLRDALAIYARTGPVSRELQVRRTLGGAFAAQGSMQEAVGALRDAESAARARGASTGDRAGLALARAELAVQLNAMDEAERWYDRAARLYRDAGDLAGAADAQLGRGLLMLARHNLPGARRTLDAALRSQVTQGDRRDAALVRLALGQVQLASGDTVLATRYLARAAAELGRAGDTVAVAVALGELAGVDEARGAPALAEARYRDALALLDGRPAAEVGWRLHAGLARVRWARGATAEAAQELRLAVAEIERSGRSLTLPERRSAFLEDKWDVYAELALVERARGRTDSAFAVSERLRARELVDLLGRGRIGGWADAGPGALAEREQDLRLSIAALSAEVEGDGAGSRRGRVLPGGSAAVQDALASAQSAYAELLLEMRERSPRYADLVGRGVSGWRDVASHLRRDEVLVEYLVSDTGSVAFVVARDTLAVIDLDIGRRELARLVEFSRGTLQQAGTSDSLWRGPLRRLHAHLIAPLEAGGLLDGITRLVIVPHAELHYLPFAALLGERGALVERYDLAVTPSATAWLALGGRAPSAPAQGVLALAPRLDALPGSLREVQAVERLMPVGTRVLTGAQATESALEGAARGKRILHLATFGVLNRRNPLFSFVDLAPDDRADGRLEVHEVFGLSLSADLVVLSACETGLGSGRTADVPAGDDWVGFTRAFLHAGARAVAATLWAVDDRATAEVMEEFYRQLGAGSDPARALARTQRRMLASTGTAHPFYWAGVVLVEGREPFGPVTDPGPGEVGGETLRIRRSP